MKMIRVYINVCLHVCARKILIFRAFIENMQINNSIPYEFLNQLRK